jgi:hypothetical protein
MLDGNSMANYKSIYIRGVVQEAQPRDGHYPKLKSLEDSLSSSLELADRPRVAMQMDENVPKGQCLL